MRKCVPPLRGAPPLRRNVDADADDLARASGALRTTFGTIKLAIPGGAGYAVNAPTSFGRVVSAVPITTTGISDENIVGTIGRGGCKLELVNANGNIMIDRE